MREKPKQRPKGRSVPVPRSDRPAGPSRDVQGNIPISVTTVYGHSSRKGYVDLELGNEGAQLTPEQARMIAGWLLEAAEAAIMDEMLVVSLMDTTGVSWEDAARLMLQLREKRERRMGMSAQSA
jgi:hypothetical protein